MRDSLFIILFFLFIWETLLVLCDNNLLVEHQIFCSRFYPIHNSNTSTMQCGYIFNIYSNNDIFVYSVNSTNFFTLQSYNPIPIKDLVSFHCSNNNLFNTHLDINVISENPSQYLSLILPTSNSLYSDADNNNLLLTLFLLTDSSTPLDLDLEKEKCFIRFSKNNDLFFTFDKKTPFLHDAYIKSFTSKNPLFIYPIILDIFPSILNIQNILSEQSQGSILSTFNPSNPWDVQQSPRLKNAIDLGHQLHKAIMFNETVSPTLFLEAETHLGTETSSGLSMGFIIAAILEGLSPNAFKQASNKLRNMMEKYLVPPLEDLMGGAPTGGQEGSNTGGGEPKNKGTSKMAPKFGALALTISRDFLKASASLSAQYGDIFANLLAQALHNELIERVRMPLTDKVSKSLEKILDQSIPLILTDVVPSSLERFLPALISSKLNPTVTESITQSVTHILTSTLSHVLKTSSNTKMACYYCYYARKYCKECYIGGGDQSKAYLLDYFSYYYQCRVGDYYGKYNF